MQGVSPRITGIGAEAVCNAMVAACHARLYLEVGAARVQQCARAAVWEYNVEGGLYCRARPLYERREVQDEPQRAGQALSRGGPLAQCWHQPATERLLALGLRLGPDLLGAMLRSYRGSQRRGAILGVETKRLARARGTVLKGTVRSRTETKVILARGTVQADRLDIKCLPAFEEVTKVRPGALPWSAAFSR